MRKAKRELKGQDIGSLARLAFSFMQSFTLAAHSSSLPEHDKVIRALGRNILNTLPEVMLKA